jgi:DNA-binding transcriptional MerR regulator/methylmalonyl-CoA mutase cobalamin-binding subunit
LRKTKTSSPAGGVTELTLDISAVERDTGLSKDTLRMWERRYGFPEPQRDVNGERVYPLKQVQKLRLVKRLMDRGHRPGKIISRSVDDLLTLGSMPDTTRRSMPGNTRGRMAGEALEANPQVKHCISLLKAHQLPDLRRHLAYALLTQGLQRFVIETVAPLNIAVGNAWMRGDIAIFEEHLYTEQIQAILRNALATIEQQGPGPRVLLTSFPNELHALGLLMVEALLCIEGAACIPLGTATPVGEIAQAVQAHNADIVALSFSAAFNERLAATGLTELRAQLPDHVSIWAGGMAMTRLRKTVPRVELIDDLRTLGAMLEAWRARPPAPLSQSSSRESSDGR